MTQMTLTFDAISEAAPGPKWAARWQRSWPAYEAWFVARGGEDGPTRAECENALEQYMPELMPVHRRLVELAGGSDRAARFLSTWCPPSYLGGCSLAAVADRDEVRLVRNYDLSPDLNEGLLLRTEWTGRAVMGMVEFLWGLSDGINDAGLSVALAYGGRSETGEGFGITTILRHVLETCDSVAQAIAALRRIPSHMAYNLVLADATGQTASVELSPGGGVRLMPNAIATNHQSGPERAERPAFTRSHERLTHLDELSVKPLDLNQKFLSTPLIQDRYAEGFGTLFTAEYDPKRGELGLTLAGDRWDQSLNDFTEGQRVVTYAESTTNWTNPLQLDGTDWSAAAGIDWQRLAEDYATGRGSPISAYLTASGDVDQAA
ncbi:C45 family peptidase [Sedimentitalea todarodis]|uniref:C45 family autoproteolytic acyltransferase/hydrolase n=1 Tax=Sedimentitalea todarodis TaxID=1631240 RepID=A0ABU3VKZ6_9RHOB|nr:C45 family peptidase [Sedimentitalea todarodis]MDU9006778.1 C45 family autoproteolytic acyltransferase/hydrolase [Sedimentitalea todarodis]